MDTAQRLSPITRVLHWAVGLAIIGMIALGFYMTTTRELWLLPYHKSIGVLIFLIALARVWWRMRNGWPVAMGQYSPLEKVLAKLTHWALILGTLGMPLTGMLDSAAGGHGFGIFGLEIFPGNHDADGKAIAYSRFLRNVGDRLHELLAYLMVAAITLHVAGALKHHWIDRDRTLLRMLGR